MPGYYHALGVAGRCMVGIAAGLVGLVACFCAENPKSGPRAVARGAVFILSSLLLYTAAAVMGAHLTLGIAESSHLGRSINALRAASVLGGLAGVWIAAMAAQFAGNGVRLAQGKKPLPVRWIRQIRKSRRRK